MSRESGPSSVFAAEPTLSAAALVMAVAVGRERGLGSDCRPWDLDSGVVWSPAALVGRGRLVPLRIAAEGWSEQVNVYILWWGDGWW